MSQKLPANNFEWIEDTFQFNEDFIKNCNEESDEGFFLEVDAQYLEKLHELHDDLLFLPERMKIEKVEKLVPNLLMIKSSYLIKVPNVKTEYVIHIRNLRNLKQALKHELFFKKTSYSNLI